MSEEQPVTQPTPEQPSKKKFVPTEKWLAAQAKLREERLRNPEAFKRGGRPRGGSKKRLVKPPMVINKSEFQDAMAAKIQQMINRGFDKLETMLDSESLRNNPVGMSLMIKNLNDVFNGINVGGGLSRAKDSKEVMKIDGKEFDTEALIRFNKSANIENLADVQRIIENKTADNK